MKMDAQINFRTSSEVKARITKLAKSKDITPSQLINEIVAEFLNRSEDEKSEVIDLGSLHKTVAIHEQRLKELEKKLAA
ncbi:MAG: hypothetical protein SAK29_02175 [Scytonema sp. PMC 1069.18]|nr:hypothetical protein [Scytonema sp. PMC 1069.18]MEC4882163.1 hypothetical protein [Scytonema sp. PMC 1070.18]